MRFESLIFGILPSLIWLSVYLREDKRPEPKWMVLLIFILGGIFTLPALFFEIIAEKFFPQSWEIPMIFLNASIEEFFKFLVLPLFLFNRIVLEEPIDGMIYMIISGLGFAAFENTFLIIQFPQIETLFVISLLRTLGAVFLHALSSAIFGYFVTCYYFWGEKIKNLFLGFFLSSGLHFLFNLSMIYLEKTKKPIFFTLPFFSLLFLGMLTLNLLQRLRKRKTLDGFFRKIKKANKG